MNLDLIGEPTGSVKEMMTKIEDNGIPVTINGTPSDQSVVLVIMSAADGPTKTSRSYIEKWKGKRVFFTGILLTDTKKVNDKELLELVYLETAEITGNNPPLLLSKDKDLMYKLRTNTENLPQICTFGSSAEHNTKSDKPWWKFW